MEKKMQKAWELTRLWYVIIAKTSNVFLNMSREAEGDALKEMKEILNSR